MDEDSVDAAQGRAVIDGLVCSVRDYDALSLLRAAGSPEGVAQHPLVAVGDSDNNL